MDFRTAIAIELGIGRPRFASAGGGCINRSFVIAAPDGTRLFAKAHPSTPVEVFEAEATALRELAATGTIRVPRPVRCGVVEGHAYLALEFIRMGPPRGASWQTFGRQLASLHRHTHPEHGWGRDNIIGATPQPNTRERSWATFFVDHRLRHQLALAGNSGLAFERTAPLLDAARELLRSHQPAPALLHGDLWSGNVAFDGSGAPVVFDPATYYGDPETDLAFTEMFGGFPAEFYAAYDEANPPLPGRETRKRLYNLYHLLNHANLFGGSYVDASQAAIDSLAR